MTAYKIQPRPIAQRYVPTINFNSTALSFSYEKALASDAIKKFEAEARKLARENLNETRRKTGRMTFRYTFVEMKDSQQKVLMARASLGSNRLLGDIYKIDENSDPYKLTSAEIDTGINPDWDDGIGKSDLAARLKVLSRTEIIKR